MVWIHISVKRKKIEFPIIRQMQIKSQSSTMLISKILNFARKYPKKRTITHSGKEDYTNDQVKIHDFLQKGRHERLQKLLQYSPKGNNDPNYDPIEHISEYLPRFPEEMFDDPNNFIGAIISGKQFNRYFAPNRDYYKILKTGNKHHDLEYKTGLNVDPNQFLTGKEYNNGLHFSWVPEMWVWYYDTKCGLRKVTIPNDAIIQIHHYKMRADKIILGPSLTDDYTKDFDYLKHDLFIK
jgi:hypothetical protein